MGDAALVWLAARGERRQQLRRRAPGRLGRALRAGGLTMNAGAGPAGRGLVTWAQCLAWRYGVRPATAGVAVSDG